MVCAALYSIWINYMSGHTNIIFSFVVLNDKRKMFLFKTSFSSSFEPLCKTRIKLIAHMHRQSRQYKCMKSDRIILTHTNIIYYKMRNHSVDVLNMCEEEKNIQIKNLPCISKSLGLQSTVGNAAKAHYIFCKNNEFYHTITFLRSNSMFCSIQLIVSCSLFFSGNSKFLSVVVWLQH